MELGAFSISLKVKDIKNLLNFTKNWVSLQRWKYRSNWIVLKRKIQLLGFSRIYRREYPTFNPGWINQHQKLILLLM